MAQPTLIKPTTGKPVNATGSLLLVFALAIAVRTVFFAGLNGSDDLEYARYADDLLRGQFHLTGFSHANRWGMILPTALFYRLFGVSVFSTCLWPILASLGQIWVAWQIGKLLVSPRVGVLAAFLLAVYPLDIHWGTQGLPEAPLAFLLGVSVLLFLRGSEANGRQGWHFPSAGLAFGLGYLVKETAVLLLPFFAGYALWKRQFVRSIPPALAGWLLVLVPEMIFYKLATGNPFFRFAGASATNAESMAYGVFDQGFFQYFYSFFAGVLMNGLFYYALIGAFIAAIRLRERRLIPAVLWMGLLFLPMEFGIESIHPIAPIHKEVKTLTMLSVPLVVFIAWWIQSLSERRRPRAAALVLMVLVVTGLSAAWLRVGMFRAEWSAMQAALPAIEASGRAPIYTDNVTMPALQFLLGFRENGRVRAFNRPDFRGRNTLQIDLSQLHGAVVVANRRMINSPYARDFHVEYPPEVLRPPSRWVQVGSYDAVPGPELLLFLGTARRIAGSGLVPGPIASRAQKALGKAVDAGPNRVEIYRCP